MKRLVTFSLVFLALLTMGLADVLSHPAAARSRGGAFNSTPDSYSYIAYASIPTNALKTHTYFGPYGSSWVGCTTSYAVREGNSVNKLTVGNVATILGGKSFVNIERAKANASAQATMNA